MASHEAPVRARRPMQSVEPRARNPQAPAQAGRCLGAAAQLAAVHRILRGGPVVQRQAASTEVVQRGGAEPSKEEGAYPAMLNAADIPSNAHDEASLSENFKNICNHQYGFSFAPLALMNADLVIINAFVGAIRYGRPAVGVDVDDVSWDTDGTKVRYTLASGRVYSTHDDSTRLYPIEGPGITNGRGALDMAPILQARGLLTEDRKIILAQLHSAQTNGDWRSRAAAPRQMGRNAKTEWLAYFDTHLQ